MASIVVLYDFLGDADTTGTWSFVGTQTSYPPAPSVYDDPVDFSGYDPGIYVYRYTVTVSSVTHTALANVVWQGDTPARTNDVCADYFEIPGTTIPNTAFEVVVEDDNAYRCSVLTLPSIPDPGDYPANWNQGVYTGDLWYGFKLPPKGSVYNIGVLISSEDFTDDLAARGFAVQFYSNTESGFDCTDDVDIWRPAAIRTSRRLNTSLQVLSAQDVLVRFRVVSITPGKFTITLTTTCE
jgi:hypothetical protein